MENSENEKVDYRALAEQLLKEARPSIMFGLSLSIHSQEFYDGRSSLPTRFGDRS
ncbi:hypothetical protein HOA55_02280 [archaeon]|jgi:hypothetical protein|nr:hypothetical protein [archaeon]MBT3577610.1 hypothetical protein [archaeon]MBT6820158.1 hypothetical protein [archaeon]MBT6956137.1 hypothetical protein [archaeon]MBT7025684.1 hypothetical protein [archaeon]